MQGKQSFWLLQYMEFCLGGGGGGGGLSNFKYFTKGDSIFLRASKRGYYKIFLYDKECPTPPYGINNEWSLSICKYIKYNIT